MSNACRADLGFLEAGSRVTLEISGYANVRLMEPEAVVLMQFGHGHVFYGGVFGPGTVTLKIPEGGRWWLIVDVERLGGPVSVSPPQIERRRSLAPA